MSEEKPRIFENEILKTFFDDGPQIPPPTRFHPPTSSRPEIPRSHRAAFTADNALYRKKGRVFSVINQKGGCGKTTTSINLAAALAAEGFEILLIDIDAQANSTLGYGLRLAPEAYTVCQVFHEPLFVDAVRTPYDLVRKTSVPGVSLLPSSKFLAPLAAEMMGLRDWEYRLRQYLGQIRESFHFVIIDCPPALNALTVNALTASDQMIIPLQTHYFSLEGMKELFLTIRSVQQKLNPLLKAGLILPTLYDARALVHRQMLESIRGYFGDQVLKSVIHTNVTLVESTMHGQPVLVYDPSSRGARDYRALSLEILKKDSTIFDGQSEELLAKFILQ